MTGKYALARAAYRAFNTAAARPDVECDAEAEAMEALVEAAYETRATSCAMIAELADLVIETGDLDPQIVVAMQTIRDSARAL